MRTRSAAAALLLAALALAGCSSLGGLGGPKRTPAAVTVDANLYPSNYRQQVATLLTTVLTSRADFHGTLIAPPALKPVADSPNLHYVVCLQFTGEPKTKVVIFLGGDPIQYVDATSDQCAGAAYQPFPELEAAMPRK